MRRKPNSRSGTGPSEILVVGAGVMRLWTAFTLRRRGYKVMLADA